VREAVFNVLTSLGEIDGADVADLFAGSGAMGIEALSRGAASVVFVDDSAAAVQAVRANLSGTGLDSDAARVERAEVLGWLLRPHRFDVALCDPPYAFGGWDQLLDRLHAGIAVLESDREIAVPATWEIIRHKRYGGTLVTVVRPAGAHQKGTL
jgi:16S rRNA (guanine966-N2)-methyltransferase